MVGVLGTLELGFYVIDKYKSHYDEVFGASVGSIYPYFQIYFTDTGKMSIK